MMRDPVFYFSGWHGPNVYTGFPSRAALTPAVLFSYADMADRIADIEEFHRDGVKLMMDSGAFSVFSRGAEIDREAYTRFLDRNQHLFEVMVALDVIGSPDRSWENYEWQRSRVPVIPVFHLGEPLPLWRDYAATNPKVMGLGGVAGDKRRGPRTMEMLHEVFAELAAPGEPTSIPIHGFAMGLGHVLQAFPWGSVDSATAVRSAGGGRLVLDVGHPMTLTIRDNRLLVNDRPLTPNEMRVVETRLAEHGYDMAGITDFSVLLAAVNILELRRVIDRIPRVYTPPRATAVNLPGL